ncbi:hypothetical protein ACLK1T_06605 [Escherichia coli]
MLWQIAYAELTLQRFYLARFSMNKTLKGGINATC